MGKNPAFLFYPSDWLTDSNLRRCSYEARAVWIDMLCLMWNCAPQGMLSTNGQAWTDQEIADAIPGDAMRNLKALGELLAKGVARRENGSGTIFSKRMIEDVERRKKNRERQIALRDKWRTKKERQRGKAKMSPDVSPASLECPPIVPPNVPLDVPPSVPREKSRQVERNHEDPSVTRLSRDCHARYSVSVSSSSSSQDHLIIEAEEAAKMLGPWEADAAAAAFSALSAEPFGPLLFQRAWCHEYAAPPPPCTCGGRHRCAACRTNGFVDAMERTIQICQRNGVPVPGRFFAHKREIEKAETSAIYRKDPL